MAYLASGVAAGRDGVVGEPYQDASGRRYLAVVVFTDELFSTYDDAANRAVVPDKLALAGIGPHGRRAVVDKVLKGLRLHP